MDDESDDEDDDDNEIIYPGLGGRQKAAIRDTMNIDEMLPLPIPQLLHETIHKDKLHPSQRRYFAKIGSMFTEHTAFHVDLFYKIHAIVKSKQCTNRQLYYQYYDMSQPKPTCNKDFAYTLCSILHTADWAD